MSFGQFLKEERKKRGMSQRLLAELIGSSNTEISRIEQEIRQKPSPIMLKKLSEVMEIPLDIIMREAGYTPHSSAVAQKIQSEKALYEIVISYAEKNGYLAKKDYISKIGQYAFEWDCVVEKNDETLWAIDFIYLLDEQKTTKHPIQIDKVLKALGLATVDKRIQKISFIFNNEVLFNNCREIIPQRMHIEISLILVDIDQKTVIQETFISQ